MSIGWGFVGTGSIATTVAAALERSPGGHLAAVASRDFSRAQAFADRQGVPAAYGGPDAVASMLADPTVDVVYVATVHPAHHAAARASLLAGTPVLVEKPMTVSSAATRDLVNLARSHDTFLMEAYWTRFVPATVAMLAIIDAGTIGTVRSVAAGMKFPFDANARRFWDPALGGGSLLDLGPYPIGLALTVLGRPDAVAAAGTLTPDGVDEQIALAIRHVDGGVSSLATGMVALGGSTGWVEGTRGSIEVAAPLHDAQGFTVRVRSEDGTTSEQVHTHSVEHGHRFMLDHVHECLTLGRTESPLVGWEFSTDLAEVIEQAMDQIGAVRAAEIVN